MSISFIVPSRRVRNSPLINGNEFPWMSDLPTIQAKEWLLSVGYLLSVGTELDGSD